MFTRSVWAVDFNMNYIAIGSSDRIVRFFLYNRDRHSSSFKEDEVDSCMAVGDEHHGRPIARTRTVPLYFSNFNLSHISL